MTNLSLILPGYTCYGVTTAVVQRAACTQQFSHVTTASVEGGFPKLSLVKSKLRSTVGQDRLEALLLASVENDILLQLDNAELVAPFASKIDRRMLLV